MDIEETYDTSEIILGQLIALKKLGYSNRKTVETISSWGYSISHATVNKHWNIYLSDEPQSQRHNCGRYKKQDEKEEKKIVSAVKKNRFLTTTQIARDDNLNPNKVSVGRIFLQIRLI